jgi:YfiH family protein
VNLPDPFEAAGEHFAIGLPGARALFTTRRGGCSTGPYASLNLGRLTDDDPVHVDRNRAHLAASVSVAISRMRQVHGTAVIRLSAAIADDEPAPFGSEPPEADGQATAEPGIAPMVLTADCLPIAIAGGGAVSVVHAGWRGLAGGVVAEGVRAVRELGAGGDLVAAIGPGAGPCCYEVGEEVHAAFAGHEAGVHVGESGRNLDLKAIARSELEAAGVTTVHDLGMCTICSELFYSHRRDHGVTGRQAGLAWLS